MTITLSTIKPDFEDIRSQLQSALGNYSSWIDLLPTGTGQTLTDFVAGVGAQDQFAIEHAFRESFRTARLDSSIYAQAILLGVRLGRKSPSSVSVSLARSDTTASLTIPAFTAFSCSSSTLFNREAITFAIGAPTAAATLYEGVITQINLGSDGAAWQLFVSTEIGSVVSDIDVVVKLNNIPLPIYTRALWHAQGSSGVQDSTTPTGQLMLTFGNSTFGTQPGTNDQISIMYAVTKGTSGQDASISGRKVTVLGYSGVTGTATTALSGGGDEKAAVFYRKLSPQLFSAGEKTATTADEYAAVANSYPGVLDAKVFGQRSMAPSDPRWMNLHQVTLLTDSVWTGAQWDTFVAWYQIRTMYPSRFFRKDAVARPFSLTLTLHCQGRADLEAVKALAVSAVSALFNPRPGIIDSNVYRSDIYTEAKNSSDTIEYLSLDNLDTDIIVGVSAPATLTLTDNGVGTGTLTAGQYQYAVTAVTSQGETLASNWTSVVISVDGSSATIAWDPLPNALSYNVYGRSIALGKITNVTGILGTYTDTGAITPVEGTPILNSAGHFYPQLTSLTINPVYTNRSFYDIGELK